MRKHALLAALALVLGMAATPVVAQSENAYSKSTGGVGYLAIGSPDARASFVAMGTPESGKGRINARNQGGLNNLANFKGVVDCYRIVSENEGVFSGRITHFEPVSDGATNSGFFRAAVSDAGSPGSIGDMIQIQRSDSEFDCEDDYDAMRPVTNGNLVVHHSQQNS